ncbi:MAG: polyphosphate kinase 2 family protein, partial [Planctomycetes bacterium]|nr:polyphosphate kinase 2 family protein [Planctomycetota bacterium]
MSGPHRLDHTPFRVQPGTVVRLSDYATGHRGEFDGKGDAKRAMKEDIAALTESQQLLWADKRYAVLIILQAMDAAGKDGTIKHVMSGVNPQGCQVFSFKQPSAEDLNHDFLWRYVKCLPERGRIGIFNRSYYEEVLVVRVHEELLKRQKLPHVSRQIWDERLADIAHFEDYLTRQGTIVLKFFLHVSRKEQKNRFIERLDQPDKRWKFSAA